MTKRSLVAFALVLAFATVLFAAEDLSGQWSGSFNTTLDGQSKQDTIHMVLKQNGTELTGTAGPSADQQWPISNGKIDGGSVTFDVQTPEPLIKFDLKLVEGHLKGGAKAEHEGRSMTAVVDAQRKTD